MRVEKHSLQKFSNSLVTQRGQTIRSVSVARPRTSFRRCLCLGLQLGVLLVSMVSAGGYEEPPIVLDTADVTPPELRSGEHFSLGDQVENDGYMNHYRIESDYGVLEAEGNMELRIRVKEVEAIAQLNEVTRSDAFQQAMKQSLTDTAETATEVVKHPVQSAKALPGGVRRFVKRTARKAEDLGETVSEEYQEQKARKDDEDEQAEIEQAAEDSGLTKEEAKEYAAKGAEVGGTYAKKWLGYTGARRGWAAQLGVDPYTDNEALNRELYRVAQAASAGGLVVRFSPVPNLAVIDDLADVSQLVYEMDPLDLRMRDEKILYAIGVSEETVESLFDNPHQTPTTVTLLTDSLSRLEGVDGRVMVAENAAEAESRAEVQLVLRSLNFLAAYHQHKRPLASLNDWVYFPSALAADGHQVAVVAVDHLSWTQEAADLVERATPRLKARSGNGVLEVWVEGGCSELATAGLTAAGFEVHPDSFVGMSVDFGSR